MNIIGDTRDALLHAVEKRSPPPLTPMDLLTALKDSWCEKPPGCLQTFIETMPRRVAAFLRACGALHDIRQLSSQSDPRTQHFVGNPTARSRKGSSQVIVAARLLENGD
ncbi:hypothetical protein AVEN_212057-1 [Araneus ventricosus]|uniref:Uncharacterized protein n=1 Tax=Araneus ventricosus TaxID=182803 RepID=A0A4Y2UTT7_ARAVE|nr:hypothetical protein AVEN_212057-1 [Araneus ventricosus]